MKILFDCPNINFHHFGGQEVQMCRTKDHLEGLGVEITLFNKFRNKIDDYDIYHLFGSDSIEHFSVVSYAKEKGIPVVLSPVFWSSFEEILKSPVSAQKKARAIVKKCQQRSEKILRYNYRLVNPTQFYLKNADLILPNSNLEARHLLRIFDFEPQKINVIYNGVEDIYAHGEPDLFFDRYGISDFVLFVGRVEQKKNLLALIKATRDTDHKLVIVGDTNVSKNYYDQCKRHARENVHFIGKIPHNSELLVSAYCAAKVFALPSWRETPGISALEAGLAGCNVLITNRGSTREYFKDMAFYCDPNRVASIRNGLDFAMGQPKTRRLSKYIREKYSWGAIAEETLGVYKRLVS